MNSVKAFIAVMLVSVLPLPVSMSAARPDMFLLWCLIVNYNSNQKEDCLYYSYIIGLLANIYYDVPIGTIAILYASLSYIFSMYFNKSLAFWQQNAFVITAIVIVEIIMLMLRSGQIVSLDIMSILPGILITVIVWYCYIGFFANLSSKRHV